MCAIGFRSVKLVAVCDVQTRSLSLHFPICFFFFLFQADVVNYL